MARASVTSPGPVCVRTVTVLKARAISDLKTKRKPRNEIWITGRESGQTHSRGSRHGRYCGCPCAPPPRQLQKWKYCRP